MPVKVYFQIALIALAGLSILSWLVARWVRSVWERKSLKIVRETAFLLTFAAAGLILASTFIPCFNFLIPAFCRLPEDQKIVALTFDDGPNEPYTSQIVEILKQHQVPATFFVVGENARRQPEAIRKILQEGFEVGNHTFDHRALPKMGLQEIRKEFDDWESVMAPLGFSSPKLFRAPHGWKPPFLSRVLREKGYRLIGWTRGVWDTDQPPEEILYRRLTESVSPGEVILLHDGMETQTGVDRSTLVKVLPRVIERYRELGFRFVSVSEFLEKS